VNEGNMWGDSVQKWRENEDGVNGGKKNIEFCHHQLRETAVFALSQCLITFSLSILK